MGQLSDRQYRELATEQYHRDGSVEIDFEAVVSNGEDDGAYVAAWVWVYDGDLESEHMSSENGCHEDCPACAEEVEAELKRREP